MIDWLDRWETRNISGEPPRPWWVHGNDMAWHVVTPPPEPVILSIEHTKYILTHGRKAYRKWLEGDV